MKLSDGRITDVAVKAPKMCLLTQGSLVDFYEEANTTIHLKHENIITCLGFYKKALELPCLIFEFMAYGSLDTLLACNRTKEFQKESSTELTNVCFHKINT